MIHQRRYGYRSFTPFLALILAPFALGGCTSTAPAQEVAEDFSRTAQLRSADPLYSYPRVVLDDIDSPLVVPDPLEAFNRTMYRLNAQVDRLVLFPTIAVYEEFVPRGLRQGVTNFFDNLDDLRTAINQLLQLRPRGAAQSFGRVLTNTTIGMAGLIDVASHAGIRRYDEDFGQTLGRYGVPAGPYLVLPLFGPSGLRDGIGRAVDAGFLGLIDPLRLNGNAARGVVYYPLLVVDTRATTAFRYYGTGSPFEYELLRLLWAKKRELDVEK